MAPFLPPRFVAFFAFVKRRLNEAAPRGNGTAPAFLLFLGVFLALRLWGLGWGVDGTWAWDNDGVAPRDVFPGVLFTFTPGKFYTYPPLHILLLAVLSLPLALRAFLLAENHSPPAIVASFLEPTTTAGVSYVARTVSLLASGLLAWCIFQTVRETHGRRAAGYAAIASMGLTSVSYYARTSNLDIPFLAWSGVALLLFTRALVHDRPDALRRPMLAVAAAVATKDQAYALFLISLPVYFVAWLALTAAPKRRAFLAQSVKAIATGIAALLFFDAALVNPRGFAARVHFLLGSASQDYAEYTKDFAGRKAVVLALARLSSEHLAAPILGLVLLGIVVAWQVRARAHLTLEGSRRQRAVLAAYLPALFAVSFAIAFNLQARRTDHRFAMPIWLYLSVYAGVGAEALRRALAKAARISTARSSLVAACAVALPSLFRVLELDVNLALDGRYAVEQFLAALPNGTTVETYGGVVYQPHFPNNCAVTRVGVDAPEKRSPLGRATELRVPFEDIQKRRPQFVVVNLSWAAPYLLDADTKAEDGEVAPAVYLTSATNGDGVHFFRDLVAGRNGYRWVLYPTFPPAWASAPSRFWLFERRMIHGTTSPEMAVFQRID